MTIGVVEEHITLAVAGDGRHVFDAIQDPRVRLTSLAETPQPDLIVFPCSRFRRFDNLTGLTLTESTLTHIARGGAGLVFDVSLEGVPHKPDVSAALRAVMRRLGATPRQCVYVTQDRQYEADYRAHCETMGVEPVHVLVHDYWIWEALNEYHANGQDEFERRLVAFRARRSQRQRKFISLNRTPRPTKILFLLRVLRDGLWDHGFISFGGFRGTPGGPGKDRPSLEQLQQALPGFEDLVAELAPSIQRLDSHGRVLLGLEQHGWTNIDLTRASMAVELSESDDSWFTIVTETEMRSRPSRITEKVLKPLVSFHPLLVLGNPHALAMIRGYGFSTFPDVFDESYDDEWDPRRRFDLVYDQFTRACQWSDEEWGRVEHRIEETLIANARWGLTTFPTSYRRQNDAALVDRILDAVHVLHRC